MSTLELTALRGHHPLGFLAACGLLRCCGGAPGSRRVGLAWKRADDRSGWLAVLHRGRELRLESLIRMLTSQASQQKNSLALNWSTKIDDRDKFRELGFRLIADDCTSREKGSLALLSALASDLALDRNKKLQPTSLDLTSGNQRFLSSICDVSTNLAAAALREALCGPWQYRDGAHSMGWDPQMQRLHALRHKLPEQDKENRSVRGAVFLASQALPLFPCFAVRGGLRTTGFHRNDREDWFAWPLWCEPISLDTLGALLAHRLNNELKQRGVVVVYRCRRVRTGGSEKGNYQVFSNAEEWL